MLGNRREFLLSSAGVASVPALAALMAEPLSAALLAQAPSAAFDAETLAFWTSEVRKSSEAFAKKVHLQGGPTYQPEFVFYDPALGFLASEEIKDSGLPKSGAMNVAVRVQRFRPSVKGKELFENVQSGSLRVDVKQTQPMPGLLEALAWSAVGAFVPTSAGKLPDLQNLTFNPGEAWGTLQQIPLTNGLGFWSWNLFLQRKQGLWGQLINIFRQGNKVVFPLLGLPAIATTALTAVDKILGWIQANEKSDWLFKSVDTPVFATQEGKTAIGQGLPLRTGQYVIVPRDQLSTFGAARKNLELRDGYVVAKGTDAFDLPRNATQQITDVDYLSLYVQVT